MSVDREKFLEVEEHANELVGTLESLRREVSSYSSATENLTEVRSHLIEMIEHMKTVASETSQAARNVRDIGGPQIVHRIDSLGAIFDARAKDTLEEARSSRESIVRTQKDLSGRIETVQATLSQIGEQIKRLMIVAYAATALAALGVVFALLGLLN